MNNQEIRILNDTEGEETTNLAPDFCPPYAEENDPPARDKWEEYTTYLKNTTDGFKKSFAESTENKYEYTDPKARLYNTYLTDGNTDLGPWADLFNNEIRREGPKVPDFFMHYAWKSMIKSYKSTDSEMRPIPILDAQAFYRTYNYFAACEIYKDLTSNDCKAADFTKALSSSKSLLGIFMDNELFNLINTESTPFNDIYNRVADQIKKEKDNNNKNKIGKWYYRESKDSNGDIAHRYVYCIGNDMYAYIEKNDSGVISYDMSLSSPAVVPKDIDTIIQDKIFEIKNPEKLTDTEKEALLEVTKAKGINIGTDSKHNAA